MIKKIKNKKQLNRFSLFSVDWHLHKSFQVHKYSNKWLQKPRENGMCMERQFNMLLIYNSLTDSESMKAFQLQTPR